MADDNIVRPVFGKKKPGTEVPRVTATPVEPAPDEVSDDYKHIGPLTGEALLRAQKDLLYMLANDAFVHEMRNKLEQAGDTIFALKGFTPDPASIRLRRQGLKDLSFQEICELVQNTHQLQWRSQPSYLGALTLEHHCRLQLALSLMNEENPSPKG